MRTSIAIAVLGLWAPLLQAQMPSDVQAKMAVIGSAPGTQTMQATAQVYMQEARKTDRSGVTPTRDLQYGPDRLQTLDLYTPQGKSGVPVVLFVHGGGYTGGDKNANPTLFSNVPIWFGRQGVLGATMNYRLAPAAPWPAGAQDVALAVEWLKKNVQSYGGDPVRIFLFGYSAGGTHVASYALDRSLQPSSGSGIAGAVLLSGQYQVMPQGVKELVWNVAAYFGEDRSQHDARSPITHVGETNVPLLVARAEFDLPGITRTTTDLHAVLCKQPERCPRLVVLKHHNHFSTVAAFNTVDEEMGRAVLSFMGIK